MQGVQERDGGFVRLELCDATRAGGQVTFQLGVHVRWKVMLDEVHEETDELGALPSGLGHVALGPSDSGGASAG